MTKTIEKYITDTRNDLADWSDTLIDELKDFANGNDLEPIWVMQTFANMLNYRVSEIAKKA